jgi:hypothetical protein
MKKKLKKGINSVMALVKLKRIVKLQQFII